MKRTIAEEGILLKIVRQSDMSHFGMHQAMDERPIHDKASSNSSAYCDIDEVLYVSCRTPTPFGQRRCIHVRIKCDWKV